MTSIYKDGRETINAATIYAAVLAAAAVAPTAKQLTAAEECRQAAHNMLFRAYGSPWGFDVVSDDHDTTKQRNFMLASVRDRAYSDWIETEPECKTPSHITFKTGARSSYKIQNTRERLEKFAAIVKTGAKLFGGGMVRTVKARAAVIWPAQSVRLVYELLQDKQYQDAAALAEEKCGGVFYEGFNHYKKAPEAFMLFAPQVVAGLSDEFKSARGTDGRYCVYGVASGLTISSQFKTRQGAEDYAVNAWSEASETKRAAAMAKAKVSDSDAARRQWMAQHEIVTEESLTERIDAYQAQDTEYEQAAARLVEQAAQDVAQVLAIAQAAAAIDQASESAALQSVADVSEATTSAADEVRELATVEAQSCEAVTNCELGSTGAPGGAHGHGSATAARPAASVSTGQQINSKSGHWSARFYTAPDGRPMMAFSESGGAGGAWPFESGRERMAALQTMARNADQAASPAKRAPRPFIEQSTEYTLRGIIWRVTVARYWVIDAVEESREPDLLCWHASKRGGRFGGTDFVAVDGEKMPRDAAARAHEFFLLIEAQDRASSAAAGVCSTPQNTEPQNPKPLSSGQFKTILTGVSEPAPDVAAENQADLSSGQFKSKIDPVLPEDGSTFERMQPVRVDLADMVARGVNPEALIGLGVYCSGDRANPSDSGAITGVGAHNQRGLVVDVTLESGYVWKAIRSKDFLNGWFSLDGKLHGAPYLAQLAGTVAALNASQSSKKEQEDKAHAKALIDLGAQYPQLKRAETSYAGGKLAAVNMRILLKAEFSGVKFSVTSDYNSVCVSWTDGPTTRQVDAIIDQFSGGHFNGMEDIYESSSSAFTELFGSAKYISTRRELSDAAIVAILAQEWPVEAGRPTLADYRSGSRATYDEHGRNRVYMASVHWSSSTNKAAA